MQYTQVNAAHGYARTPPNLFNLRGTDDAKLSAFYQVVGQTSVSCPAEGFMLFDHCYVYDGCYVMDPALEWVPDTVIDLGIAEIIKPVIQDVIRGRHQRKLPASPMATVVIAKAGFDNYGHTLTDILPKLVTIARSGLTAIRLLLPTGMQHFAGLVTAVLARAGVQSELEFHAPATLVEAEGIYVFTAVARHNTRKSATFLEFADMVRALYGITRHPSRRIFVPRRKDDYRTLAQSAAVEAAFARHGFEIVYPADLDLEGQVRLFASASHVAGPLGAGMANIGWAPPGCDVFMIDPGMGDYYFWDFTCLLRQRFNWLFAGPLRGHSDEMAASNYDLDLELLGATLRLVYG